MVVTGVGVALTTGAVLTVDTGALEGSDVVVVGVIDVIGAVCAVGVETGVGVGVGVGVEEEFVTVLVV